MAEFGPTGKLVYDRTYSRPKQDGTRETWAETVRRVVDGNLALVPETQHDTGERAALSTMIEDFKIIPAGRQLWASGVRGRQFLYNCFVSGWGSTPSEHFEFTFMRLMEGGGVGANYSNQLLAHFEPVSNRLNLHIVCDSEHEDYSTMRNGGLLSSDFVDDWEGCFQVEDSREGWAEALVDLIDTYYRQDVKHINRVYDVSRVRPSGSKLRTYGGYASGPEPLARMLHEVSAILSELQYGWLDGMSAMKIDHAVAQCVVAGGNRRSARMSMMHWKDEQINEFLTCKQDTGSHWSTNISVEVDRQFHIEAEDGNTHAQGVLAKIAEGMLANGEPGIWNSSLSQQDEPNAVEATNPCLTGDTVIATVDGPRTFADLAEAGKDVDVYSWEPSTKRPVVRWMRRPHKTRENAELLKVTFDSGLIVRCTPDHSFYTFRGKKVQAKDLMKLRSKSIRAFSASRDAYNNELSNLAVMTPYEHASYDYPLRLDNGFYHGFHPANHKVVSVEPSGFADVYNGMVEGSHTYIILDPEPIAGHMSGIVSANCGEIALEPWEACNLGHVNLAAFIDSEGKVDYQELFYAHYLISRFLIRSTFGDRNDPKQCVVMDRNRRIGVGHFGFAEFAHMQGFSYAASADAFGDLLDILKHEVKVACEEYAHQLRIPVPVKQTTVAPTGTIAKLPGTSEGIHPIFSKHFIRRIRFSTVDPRQVETVERYRADGHNVVDDIYADNTVVVEIPTEDIVYNKVANLYGEQKADEIVQSPEELTLEDMLSVQEMYQRFWADNAVSYTANIDANKYTTDLLRQTILDFIWELKGFTVFPEMSMPLSPYERISKAQYDDYTNGTVEDSVDEECASGACPVR